MSWEVHCRVIQKQSQINMIKKYLKKDIYPRRRTENYWWYKSIIMEYEEILNFLDNTLNRLSKFKTKNWVEINGESRGTFHENNQIRNKTSLLRSGLHDYSDVYILAKGTITAINTAAQNIANNSTNKSE